jgi:hypothetical protein
MSDMLVILALQFAADGVDVSMGEASAKALAEEIFNLRARVAALENRIEDIRSAFNRFDTSDLRCECGDPPINSGGDRPCEYCDGLIDLREAIDGIHLDD